jgi:hypothetical protein
MSTCLSDVSNEADIVGSGRFIPFAQPIHRGTHQIIRKSLCGATVIAHLP